MTQLIFVLWALYLMEGFWLIEGSRSVVHRNMSGPWRVHAAQRIFASFSLRFVVHDLFGAHRPVFECGGEFATGDTKQRDAFDRGQISALIQSFEADTVWIRRLSIAQQIVLFILLPYQLWGRNLGMQTQVLALGAAVLWLSSVALTWIVARRRDGSLRSEHVAMLFVPTNAVRAVQILSRPILRGYDPVAVLAALESREEFMRQASPILRDLTLSPDDPDDETRVHAIGQLLRDHDIEPDASFEEPVQRDSDAARYCPRCHAQYVAAAQLCAACDDLPLQDFHD